MNRYRIEFSNHKPDVTVSASSATDALESIMGGTNYHRIERGVHGDTYLYLHPADGPYLTATRIFG